MKQEYSIYDQVVEITADYLGPAAKRFIDRQVISHLKKDPERMTMKDLSKLKVWIEAVVSLLTDDNKVISEYIHKLDELSQTGKTDTRSVLAHDD